ncbi:MAG: dolichyl-phosphate beta-glucosyltransferase [Pseudomonadota bacterium]|jgi:dolichyl-phosphate beta-glucosyltransferase
MTPPESASPADLQHTVHNWLESQESTANQVEISIVVPAFNEERRLPPTLIDMIDYFDRQPFTYEIIVVDDGSRDGTAEVVRKFERVRHQVKLIQLPKNQGKGHAVRLGVLNTHGKYVLFADADGATPIDQFARLYSAVQNGAQIAIGSRALASLDTKVSTSVHRRLLGRIFNRWVNTVLLPSITDTQCGFKMFTRCAALFLFRRQHSDRFSFDVEILYIATKASLRIQEVAINWNNIPGSKVNLVVDSLRMLRDVLRFRVLHRNVTSDEFSEFERSQLLPLPR